MKGWYKGRVDIGVGLYAPHRFGPYSFSYHLDDETFVSGVGFAFWAFTISCSIEWDKP